MPNKSTSFDLLDERVRKWIFRQGWYSLRDIQENAIPVVLSGDSDVIISASTAGGKTEAAFLPILTRLLRSDQKLGYQVLYLSPLKALINDQYRRLSDMTLDIPIQVNPWHGDISASRKKKSIQSPNGILIITPESLESLLINRTDYVTRSSYNNDIIFKISSIDNNIYVLKGINVRLVADAFEDDLIHYDGEDKKI